MRLLMLHRGRLATRHAAVASLVFLAAVSCAEDGPAGPSHPRRMVASVAVSPATATLSLPGDTVRLTAEARDGQGNAVAGATFSWASSDGSVVTVDAGGLVTAVSGGTAAVTVREGSSGLNATALLVVADDPRDVLFQLHTAMRGHFWINSENWRTDAPLGTWYGVTTDEQGRVIELDLSDNGLAGSIPPAIARLATLVVLDLSVSDDSIAGQLERGAGRSPRPHPGLSLDAGLDGSLDPGRDGDPDMPGGTRLAETDLAETDARPLARQGLTGPLPRTLGALSHLGTLNLSGNSLTGPIPPELGRLAALDTLDLGLNALTGPIPPELGDLSHLKVLRLPENGLTGPIPRELGRLAQLEELQLRENSLAGAIPPELGNLPNLRELYLTRNELTGSIPPEFGNLASLENLWIGRNDLTGTIPVALGDLQNLEELYLWSNDLAGPIPLGLASLPNLRELWLSYNELVGPIPPELGNVSSLEALVLLGNELTGGIPPELGNLSNLWGLSVSDNDLTGPIPPELGNLENLTQLSVSRNRLTGPIPLELTGLTKFEKLWLYLNRLTGPVPPELGGLANLDWLSLAHNELSGPIPPSFGGLTRLEYLNLTANAGLSGALPTELAGLELLETLLARGTALCAPEEAGFLEWLRSLEDWQGAACRRVEGSRVYLTQAVQSLEYPVPLLAGEPALLRVFVTAERATDTGIPPVRAFFYLDGIERHRADIPAQSARIPTAIDEGAFDQSANVMIPGDIIQPGLEMSVYIDPDATLDPELGVTRRIPEAGWTVPDIREMPVLDLTVIPYLLQGSQDRSILNITDTLTADDDLLWEARTLLPVAGLDLTVHEPVFTSSHDSFVLLRETALIRTMEGGSGYYLGTIPGPFADAVGGRAQIGGWASVAQPAAEIIAHELGHNMSLRHAPCGRPRSVDSAFPNTGGSIGAWGYDFRAEALKPPGTPDLMSYCRPRWVSDYSFAKALRHRLEDEAGADAARRTARAAAPTPSLVLWGGVDEHGVLFLEPAFVAEAPPPGPGLPAPPARYRIRGTASDGEALFAIDVDMRPIADGNGGSGFAVALPVESAWSGRLAEIRLTGPEGEAVLDGDSDRPMAILRDPENGRVRGILRGLPPSAPARQDLASVVSEPGLEILFSRGLPEARPPR
ncbi:leucine-rich repeat domain-containing protein [Candidatus Palauibacter irciniicola]|uniref:leucine-rich repeat domain-containing protein n=1 Tax=Candidatus Palauibacter irciniicola TaxID=3056733 RepID=UPI003B0162BA